MPYEIPQDVRPILEKLAEFVLPIQDWINQPGKVVPRYDQFIPPLNGVPWRPVGVPPTLGVGLMNIVEYLEMQADNDSANEALAPRWRQIKATPTLFFKSRTGQSGADWRAGRAGLSATAQFGAFDPTSNNFAFFSLDQNGKPKDALSRKEFYDKCWDPLVKAFKAAPPSDTQSWSAFLDKLRTDQLAAWPTSQDIRSSSFIRQFTIDLLIASLGQKNKAIGEADPVWQRAVLIEVGENRHPGNRYSVQDADQAVQTFVKAF
jgi:hypothetical protein